MVSFLGFDLRAEFTPAGLVVFGESDGIQTAKTVIPNAVAIAQVEVLKSICNSDLGAAFVVNASTLKVEHFNLAAERFKNSIDAQNIDFSDEGFILYSTDWDGRNAALRLHIKRYGEYYLVKIMGVYSAPNLPAETKK